MYWEEGLSINQIAKRLGVSYTTVWDWMAMYGIPRRNRREATRLRCEKKLPDEITEDLAYIFGVYLGDGSVFRNEEMYSYGFQLQVKDYEFACSVRDVLKRLGLNPKLYEYKLYRVFCYSKQLYERLTQTPIDEPLRWSPDLQGAFVRGLYESEGCIYFNGYSWYVHVVCNTNTKLMDVVESILCQHNFDVKRWVSHPKVRMENLRLRGGKGEVKRFLCWIRPCIKWPEELRDDDCYETHPGRL